MAVSLKQNTYRQTYARKLEYKGKIERLTGRAYACKLGHKSQVEEHNARSMLAREVASTRQRSLQSSTYGRMLDRNAQEEDLIGRAYGRKMLVREVTIHLQLLTAMFLKP